MDFPARDTVTQHIMKKNKKLEAIDKLIAQMGVDEPGEGEFTAKEFYAQTLASGKKTTINSVRSWLSRMANDGKLNARKVSYQGKLTNLYSYKQ